MILLFFNRHEKQRKKTKKLELEQNKFVFVNSIRRERRNTKQWHIHRLSLSKFRVWFSLIDLQLGGCRFLFDPFGQCATHAAAAAINCLDTSGGSSKREYKGGYIYFSNENMEKR
jgi:hypothetical protein